MSFLIIYEQRALCQKCHIIMAPSQSKFILLWLINNIVSKSQFIWIFSVYLAQIFLNVINGHTNNFTKI